MISYEELSEVFDMENPLTLEYFELCNKDSVEQTYCEVHHILPESIFPEHRLARWNLVKLTFGNHYRAHEILPIICIRKDDKRKMVQSWNIMIHLSKDIVVDKEAYVKLKKLHRDSMSGAGNPNFGVEVTGETRKKISDRNRGKVISEETRMKHRLRLLGVPMKDEIKKKISKANEGRPKSEETKKKLAAVAKGRITSDETKRKQSEAHKGRKQTPDAIAKTVAFHLGRKRPPETGRKISIQCKVRAFKQGKKTKLDTEIIDAIIRSYFP